MSTRVYYDKHTVLMIIVIMVAMGLIIGGAIASYNPPQGEPVIQEQQKETPSEVEQTVLKYAGEGISDDTGLAVPTPAYHQPIDTPAVAKKDTRVCYLILGHEGEYPIIQDSNTIVIPLGTCQGIVEYLMTIDIAE